MRRAHRPCRTHLLFRHRVHRDLQERRLGAEHRSHRRYRHLGRRRNLDELHRRRSRLGDLGRRHRPDVDHPGDLGHPHRPDVDHPGDLRRLG